MAISEIPASNSFDQLLSHIKEQEESTLQENLTLKALFEQEGYSISSLDEIYTSREESDNLTEKKLNLVYHICLGRRVLRQEYISVLASQRFLLCIQHIVKERLNFDTGNEVENYFQKISYSIQHASSLKELNDYYSHYLELIECNNLGDTTSIKEQFRHRYILILARGFPDYTQESLINHLKEIKRMDEMKIDFDFTHFKETATFTAIIHADTSGFIQDLRWFVKELNTENEAIANYIEAKYDESIHEESKTIDNRSRNVLYEEHKSIYDKSQIIFPEEPYKLYNYGDYLIAKWRVNLRDKNMPGYVIEYYSSNRDLIYDLVVEEERIIKELSESDKSFLKYYGFYEAHDPENRNIMEKYSFGIVMEGFDCKLDRDIRKRRVEEYEFNIKEFEEAVRDLVSAVQVMHEHGYSHLSISFDNLVIGYDGHIKIVDFHLAALNKLNRLTPSAFDNVMKKFRAPETSAI